MTPAQHVEKSVDRFYWYMPPDRRHAIELLRAEHRAIVRLVKRLQKQYLAKRNFSKTTQKRLAYLLALDDLLAALAKRQKGTR